MSPVMSRRRRFVGANFGLAVAALGWASSSCAPSGFLDQSQVESVRILASSADEPYAKPGDTVTLSVLAFDGRPTKPEPMVLYWLPFVCENPPDDAYYGCFAKLAAGGAADGGPPQAGGVMFKPGVDLTPVLPEGPTYAFQVPADAITSHPVVAGEGVPYGLVFIFNVACAGHIEIVPFDSDNPQQPPIGCFDSSHNALGPDDWVFGFTRVYAYASLTNANPVISPGVDVQGKTFPDDPSVPSTVFGTVVAQHCSGSCTKVDIGPLVPPSSQEVQTQLGPGYDAKEEIWADFYSTLGTFDDDARLLYDPSIGSLGGPSVTDNSFIPPSDPGDGFIWIVVHDNRGGATWVTIPVQVE
jgi:hypothetical protein